MTCTRTDDLLAAAWAGDLDDAGERHVAGCRDCADALLIDGILAREAAAARDEARVPPAATVWREARRAAESARRARAERWIAWVHRGVWVGALAVAAVVLWTAAPEASALGGWLGQLVPDLAAMATPPDASTAGAGGSAPLFALVGVVLTALLLGLYGEWAEG